MRLSLGILAWNEEKAIGRTIASLAQQTLMRRLGDDIEQLQIICVPNGCSDDTAGAATRALKTLADKLNHPALTWQVCELRQGGKANAWNHFVHHFADEQADYLILMDADVALHGEATLELLARRLEQDQHACVATPQFIKDIALSPRKSLFDQLSLAISSFQQKSPALLAGGLYCARASFIRHTWMPLGLLVEDGFLRAMILTDHFRKPEDFARIVSVDGAGLVFEDYRGLRRIFHHERRLVMGATMNTLLFREIAALPPGIDRGQWIRDRNAADPAWVMHLVGKQFQKSGYWIIPPSFIGGRMSRLHRMEWHRAAMWFPLALAASLFDLPVFVAANHRLRQGSAEGAWR